MAKLTTQQAIAFLGTRGTLVVNTHNRGIARRFVASCGIADSHLLTNSAAANFYNDTTNGSIYAAGGDIDVTLDIPTRIDLNVPYTDKDAAKAQGATWDAAKKVWCIFSDMDSTPFEQWIDGATPVEPAPVIEPTPVAPVIEPTPVDQDAAAKKMAELMALLSNDKPEIDESQIIALIKKHAPVQKIEIKKIDGQFKVIEGAQHEVFEDVLTILNDGLNVMLVGPAGSGKTTIAEKCAESLGLEFYFNGAIASEYKLSGFIDAQGQVISTAFRKAYENGGLYLFDELDASMPQAVLSFNAALANGHADFPDRMVERHPDFVCIAASNTYGHGADRQYVGRNQLDAATLDRFVVVDMNYDEKLEAAFTDNQPWLDRVQSVRKAVNKLSMRFVVSPRATINGSKLLASGMPQKRVEQIVLFKGMNKDDVKKINNEAAL